MNEVYIKVLVGEAVAAYNLLLEGGEDHKTRTVMRPDRRNI